MSSLHIVLGERTCHDLHDERVPGSNDHDALLHPFHTSVVEPEADVLQRVADFSLSRFSSEAPPDADDNSSPAATDLVSALASTPLTPGSGSVTSFDFERDSESNRTPSLSPQPSIYSLTESLREQAIRCEHGRGVNTHSEVYKLAADEEEAERQDRQHRLYKEVFGDYVPPFREVLADSDDPLNPKSCLDIGCGSGAWPLEVASEFPHVLCTAVDLAPLPALTQIPSNLRFEIDDVGLGLEHFSDDFDVVHVRMISSGIRDYYRLMDDSAVALRPRGLADFTETDWRVYDIEKRAITPITREIWGEMEPPEGWMGTGMARSGSSPVRRPLTATMSSEPSPYVARFLTLARQAVHKRGGHVDAAALLHRWISEHRAYEDVTYREIWLPIGDWVSNPDVRKLPAISAITEEEIERHRWTGKEAGEDLLEFMRSARPLLLSTGVPEDLVDSLTAKASQEIREARIPMYVRIQNVHARKKERRPDSVTSPTP